MSFLKALFGRKPSQAEAAAQLIGRLQRLRPDLQFDYRPAEQLIRTDDGVISLANFYLDYRRATAAEREQLLDVFAQGILPPSFPDDLATARGNLLPAMRHLAGLDLARIAGGLQGGDREKECLQPFSDELAVGVVYDTEHGMASVGHDEFAKWGITAEEAHAIAVGNLRQKAPSSFERVAPGLWTSSYGDYYDAARVLLPEHVYQLSLPGHPVAMVLNRSVLVVAGDGDAQALAGMLRLAAHVLNEEPRPLSSEMFRLADGRWRPWRPAMPEISQALHQLQVQQLAGNYQEQQAALDQYAREKQIEAFVAAHSLLPTRDGRVLSYCVLTKGVPSWLPRSDLIMLVDPAAANPKPKPVRWQVFEREAGHLLERLPYTLPRFRVLEHPGDELVARMEAATM